MTLFVPCIQTCAGAGYLPENWELPLRFVPASPQLALTMIPVKEIPTETHAAQTTPTTETTPPADLATTDRLSILQVIDTGDAYILVGAFTPPAPAVNEKGIYAIEDQILTDSNSQVIEWQPAVDLDLTPYIVANRDKDVWALKITLKTLQLLCTSRTGQCISTRLSRRTLTHSNSMRDRIPGRQVMEREPGISNWQNIY